MAVNDLYRASINTIVNGVNTLNVMHFKQQDADGAEVPADSLKAALETVILPLWVPMLSNDTVIASVVVRRILPTGAQPFVYALAGGTGTVAQEAEPANVAVVGSIYTTEVSKKGRGRNYYAGIAQTMVQGAIPTAAFVALFNTFKNALISAFIDAGSAIHWKMQLYSPSLNLGLEIKHIEQRMQLRVLRERIKN